MGQWLNKKTPPTSRPWFLMISSAKYFFAHYLIIINLSSSVTCYLQNHLNHQNNRRPISLMFSCYPGHELSQMCAIIVVCRWWLEPVCVYHHQDWNNLKENVGYVNMIVRKELKWGAHYSSCPVAWKIIIFLLLYNSTYYYGPPSSHPAILCIRKGD